MNERQKELELYNLVAKADELCYYGFYNEEEIEEKYDDEKFDSLFEEIDESSPLNKGYLPYKEKATNKVVLITSGIEGKDTYFIKIKRYYEISEEILQSAKNKRIKEKGYFGSKALFVISIASVGYAFIYFVILLASLLYDISNGYQFVPANILSLIPHEILLMSAVLYGLSRILKELIDKKQ